MHSRFIFGAAVLAAVGGALIVAPAVSATGTPSGSTVVAECRSVVAQLPSLPDPPLPLPSVGPLPPSQPLSQTGPRGCRSAESAVWGAAAGCRLVDDQNPAQCASIDGRTISPDRVAAYERSGVHAALSLQRGLDATAPLFEEQIPHTHNSFNTSAYDLPKSYPTLTNQDPNQVYSLIDQLNMDVRFLELDLHWVPSPFGNASTGFKWVTLCHGDSANPVGVHVGCTDDRPLQFGLAEIRAWMDAHPDEFVFIYFENQLAGAPLAHEIAGQLIGQAFDVPGHGVVKPSSRCGDMPLATSRAAMEATGSHLLIVGNCDPSDGQATTWGTLVHSRGPLWVEGGDPTTYDATKSCAADERARSNDTNFRRWFGDDTFVAAATGHDQNITAQTAGAMVRCGVNIIGFDQLMPDDGRLAALVWSWTPTQALQPSGPCAVQDGTTGRFEGAPCGDQHHFACHRGGQWQVTTALGRWNEGAATCQSEYPGAVFGVPANGYRNQLLQRAHGGDQVWLNYRLVGKAWTPNASAV